MTRYVTLIYDQHGMPLDAFAFIEDSGEAARAYSLQTLPPPSLRELHGVTSLTIITRVLSRETWPLCHWQDCSSPACLAENSAMCLRHTKEWQQVAMEIPQE